MFDEGYTRGTKDQTGPLDHVIQAIATGLIVALVVSLLFFVLGRTQEKSAWTSVHWVVFWQVFGTVLICRMSLIGEFGGNVGRYGFFMAIAGFLVASVVMENMGINLGTFQKGFVLVVLAGAGWLSYKITWDCTDLGVRKEDDDGLLLAAGMKKDLNPGKKRDESSWGFKPQLEMEYNQKAEEVLEELKKEKPKKPQGGRGRGTWVLYFFVASLPIFGLGYSIVPNADPSVQRASYLYLSIYMASAMGLLMSTSFLSVRKDLRRRGLDMPVATSMFWLVAGAGLVLGSLLLAGVLPQPGSYTDPLAWTGLKPSDREASKYSQGESDSGKGEGKAGSKEGKKGEKGGDVTGKKGDGTTDAEKGSKGGGKQGKSDSSGGDKENKSKSGGNKTDSGKEGQPKNDGGDQQKGDASPKSSSTPPNINIPGLDKFMKMLEKLIIALAVIGTVLFVLYVAVYKLSYSFGWAQDLLEWLQKLFGFFQKSQKIQEKDKAGQQLDQALVTASFHDFQNPFDSPDWEARDPRKLAGYSWLAMLAWARDRQLQVPDGCAPSEMKVLLSNEAPAMEEGFAPFQQVLYQAQYGPAFNSPKAITVMRKFWGHLEGSHSEAAASQEN
ncbi:MAG: hypothetical protein EXR99_14915 [Gemmataceae bacterium]|nr:hypothetical protein [Gemmataceae bacterium]